jgi:hypothetical protein
VVTAWRLATGDEPLLETVQYDSSARTDLEGTDVVTGVFHVAARVAPGNHPNVPDGSIWTSNLLVPDRGEEFHPAPGGSYVRCTGRLDHGIYNAEAVVDAPAVLGPALPDHLQCMLPEEGVLTRDET